MPKTELTLYTFVPEVYENSPYIDKIVSMVATSRYDTKLHNIAFIPFHLELIGKKQIDTSLISLVDLQSILCLGRVLEDKEKTLDLWWIKSDEESIEELISQNNIDPNKLIILHANKTWPTRTFPDHVFYKVLDGLIDRGYDVVVVGKNHQGHSEKYSPRTFDISMHKSQNKIINLINKLTMHQTVALCNRAKAILTTDSGLVHVAGCTDTNIIGIFTCVSPEMRRPYRSSSYHHKWYPMWYPHCDCYDHWTIAIDIYKCPKDNFICFPSANQILEHTQKVMEDYYIKEHGTSFFQYEWENKQ